MLSYNGRWGDELAGAGFLHPLDSDQVLKDRERALVEMYVSLYCCASECAVSPMHSIAGRWQQVTKHVRKSIDVS
jgi:hypothetical protein